jgi:hypothetical protein
VDLLGYDFVRGEALPELSSDGMIPEEAGTKSFTEISHGHADTLVFHNISDPRVPHLTRASCHSDVARPIICIVVAAIHFKLRIIPSLDCLNISKKLLLVVPTLVDPNPSTAIVGIAGVFRVITTFEHS